MGLMGQGHWAWSHPDGFSSNKAILAAVLDQMLASA